MNALCRKLAIVVVTLGLSAFSFSVVAMRLSSSSGSDHEVKKGKHLCIPDFLQSIQTQFYIQSSCADFIRLKTVLEMYHPDKHGNISEKNLKKLCRMAIKAKPHWNHNPLYSKMLEQIHQIISHGTARKEFDPERAQAVEDGICAICRESLQEDCLTLFCDHSYCQECLLRWYTVWTPNRTCCPCCRRDFGDVIQKKLEALPNYRHYKGEAISQHEQDRLLAEQENAIIAMTLQQEEFDRQADAEIQR